MTSIKTFSYDAHLVNLKGLVVGWTLALRPDCDFYIMTISEQGQDFIYVTNYDEFICDRDKYVKDAEDSENSFEAVILRGMQFDVIENIGYLYTSYTYIKGTMRIGGFDNYGLK